MEFNTREFDRNFVEMVAAAVVREYLHGKGYQKTLQCIDSEIVRTGDSISSRSALAKALGLEKLLKKNKQNENALKSMLEVLIKYFLSHAKNKKVSTHANKEKCESVEQKSIHKNCTERISSPEHIMNLEHATCPRDSIDDVSNNTFLSTIDKLGQQTKDNTKALPKNYRLNPLSVDFGDEFKKALCLTKDAVLKKHGQVKSTIDLKQSEYGQHDLTTADGTQLGIDTHQDNAGNRENEPATKSTIGQHRKCSGPVTRGGLQSDRGNRTSAARRNFLSSTANHPVKLSVISQSNEGASVRSLDCSASLGKNVLQAGAEAAVCEAVSSNINSSEEAVDYNVMGNHFTSDQPVNLPTNKTSLKIALVGICGDMEVGDLDELDESSSGVLVSPDHSYVWLTMPQGAPIQHDTAIELKTLLLGSCKKDFPLEWKIQSFCLCANPKLNYGIIQKKGGPCGVLACVQAYLIKELMFVKSWKGPIKVGNTEEECKKCLVSAIAHILWKIGHSQKAIIVMPTNRTIAGLSGLHDGFIERINLMQFTDFAGLHSFLTKHMAWFTEDNKYSCISFLYSAILSRGIDSVKKDMDDPNSCLIGTHGYCSQEVVNLLLTGCASSNVFDNVITLDDGKESQSILKGVTQQSDIGLLALFEHYNSCQVGAFLKCPRYPIWVVCSESHFSVLFAKDQAVCESSIKNDNKINKFDLYYYDGLLHQEDEIRLTISLSNNSTISPSDLIPPLDLCIKTKWKDAHVEWNGIEPLL